MSFLFYSVSTGQILMPPAILVSSAPARCSGAAWQSFTPAPLPGLQDSKVTAPWGMEESSLGDRGGDCLWITWLSELSELSERT